jgi:hypothetical protein
MRPVDSGKLDYEGASLSSRTANSKAAASTISDLFQKHYPEFLVRVPLPIYEPPIKSSLATLGAQVLRKCPNDHDLDILAFQAYVVRRDTRQDESCWKRPARDREGAPSTNRCQRTARTVWGRRKGRVVIHILSVYPHTCDAAGAYAIFHLMF